MVHREPLHADELDRQVFRGMAGFEFGSEEDIEKKLVAILKSEEYIRAVQHWEKKRNNGSHLNGHGKKGSRWGDLFSPSFEGNTSSKGDPPTRSIDTKRFAGFDFDRQKLFSISTPPVSPTAYSISSSQNQLFHPSLNEPHRERPDPTRGYHPLLSMYYLAREKLTREFLCGPGQFPSLLPPIQEESSGAASPASSFEDDSSSTSGVNIHIDRSSAKREKESSPPTAAGSRADYNRALPHLPAPDTLLYSGTSYYNVNANDKPSVLSLQERDQAEAKKEEDARGNEEELQRNEGEARRKEKEAKQKEQDVRGKEEEAKKKEEELRKKDEEVRRRETEVRKYEEEVRKHADEARKRETEARKHEEEVKKREEEVRKCEEEVRKREEEVRKCEEDMRKRAEEARQKELEARQKNDVDMVCARLFILLQTPESFKKLVCPQEHQAQEMMDLLQKVRLAFTVSHHVHLTLI